MGFDFVNAGLGSRHSFLVLPVLFGTPSTTTPSPPMTIFFIVPLLLAAVAKQSLTDSVRPMTTCLAMAAKLVPMYEILPTDELKLLPTSRTLGCLLTSGILRTQELKLLPRRMLHQCYTLRTEEDVSYGLKLCKQGK